MCLGVPVKIIEITEDKNSAICEYQGVRRKVNIRFVPDVKIGDYVILHAGFAIQKVEEKSAHQIYDLLNQIEHFQ